MCPTLKRGPRFPETLDAYVRIQFVEIWNVRPPSRDPEKDLRRARLQLASLIVGIVIVILSTVMILLVKKRALNFPLRFPTALAALSKPAAWWRRALSAIQCKRKAPDGFPQVDCVWGAVLSGALRQAFQRRGY